MSKDNLIKEYEEIVKQAREELKKNIGEWEDRYYKYILPDIDNINAMRKAFQVQDPIFAYLSVSRVLGSDTNQATFDLRYQGQSVAEVIVKRIKSVGSAKENNNSAFEVSLKIDKDRKESNLRDYIFSLGDGPTTKKYPWRDSKEAKSFRSFFSSRPPRAKDAPRLNQEHKFESEILTDMLQTSSVCKNLIHVQPVLLGHGRFQMPTPFMASKAKDGVIGYAGKNGGGIDILAHAGIGRNATHLCVIEVKDQNKPDELPQNAMKQAIAYATFIHELLRNKKNGKAWWNIFGFNGDVREKLTIYTVVAMPKGPKDEIYPGEIIKINENDKFELHYIYIDSDAGVPIGTTLPKSAQPDTK